jgi:chemotaxis-related protein WspB
MLILGLNIGNERYGIKASQVVEIIPSIKLKKIPLAEKAIKGIFDYRGTPTPVIDLCQLFEGLNCNNNLSTRIVIINYQTLANLSRPVGLVAEQVTTVMKCEAEKISTSGIKTRQNDFLGELVKFNNEMIQLIDTHHVLPDSIRNQLADKFI